MKFYFSGWMNKDEAFDAPATLIGNDRQGHELALIIAKNAVECEIFDPYELEGEDIEMVLIADDGTEETFIVWFQMEPYFMARRKR